MLRNSDKKYGRRLYVKKQNEITQARYNFALAFEHCCNGDKFPFFREISVSELGCVHTGYFAIGLLDEALDLKPDFQEARELRGDIWHAILAENYDGDDYNKYLNSKAWSEKRDKYFEKYGEKCIYCGHNEDLELHHKIYDNIGKENLIDLSCLCERCHNNAHQSRNRIRSEDYWDKFKAYITENGNQLELFPAPDLPSIFGIVIEEKTKRTNPDIHKPDASWLIAFRNKLELKATFCTKSRTRYDTLKKMKHIVSGCPDNLGEVKWNDKKMEIGFTDETVGSVFVADTAKEFLWLYRRLLWLHKTFHSIVNER